MVPQPYLSGIGPQLVNNLKESRSNATYQQLIPTFNHTQGLMMEFGPIEFADRLFLMLHLVIFALPFFLLWITHFLNYSCSFHDPFFGFDRKTCWTTMP